MGALPSCSRPAASSWAGTALREAHILSELNALRADPRRYALRIEERLPFYTGNVLRLPNQPAIMTSEGAKAAKEAIGVLRATSALPTLARSPGLMASARDHARDIGPKGRVSHESSRGETLASRVQRHVRSWDYLGEAISFGPEQPRSVVLDLLVDDNVPDRGHRRILLDPDFGYAGVSCGPHAVWRALCVIDFAGKLVEK